MVPGQTARHHRRELLVSLDGSTAAVAAGVPAQVSRAAPPKRAAKLGRKRVLLWYEGAQIQVREREME